MMISSESESVLRVSGAAAGVAMHAALLPDQGSPPVSSSDLPSQFPGMTLQPHWPGPVSLRQT